MMRFTKAHAYGNDFLYVLNGDVGVLALDLLARALCDRHAGAGADGLIVYEPTAEGASMRLFNADGSRSEVSGNGVRGLGALLLRDESRANVELTIQTEAGPKRLTRTGQSGSRQTFRAQMGLPRNLRQVPIAAAGESFQIVVMDFGNPQAVVLGALPDRERFQRLGAALERHEMFPERTNVEFAQVESREAVRILIWERGVGPTQSSGTGSCASLIAASAFGGAARDAQVTAPGGTQRVEWRGDSVYLTGWAEVLFDGTWLKSD
ncbi:MAG: diaminopimelate epimerase [Acidobacteria bacterium 13_1_40CM_65_14]|nr:MAG: diaminopimelate epimerase [Acidobacteria bacterium 13_1_40CM_65_14]